MSKRGLLLLLLAVVGQCAAAEHVRVHRSRLQTLVFYAGRQSKARRVSSVPQVKCVGGNCNANGGYDTIKVITCVPSQQGTRWSCIADMFNHVRFGRTDVTCEGWDHSEDEYLLEGSCGVEYTLETNPVWPPPRTTEWRYDSKVVPGPTSEQIRETIWKSAPPAPTAAKEEDTVESPTPAIVFGSTVIGVILTALWFSCSGCVTLTMLVMCCVASASKNRPGEEHHYRQRSPSPRRRSPSPEKSSSVGYGSYRARSPSPEKDSSSSSIGHGSLKTR